MKLTIIIPVFNEVRTILQAVKDAENIRVADKEIIIIDNDSTDGTRELLKSLKPRGHQIILNEKNINSGSFIKGLNAARGEYMYVHHSDLEYDPPAAAEMLAVAEEGGYDVVLGSRIKNWRGSAWNLISQRPEYLATVVATALVNRWYGKNFTDIIGSRLYRTAAIRKIPISTTGYGFEFESVSRMCRYGFKMAEMAVSYKPRSWKEGKKIRPYHIYNALYALFRVRFFG